MRHLSTATLALATAFALPAAAQDVVELEEIVIHSAGLEPRPADRTGPSVSVLGADGIRKTGEARLTEVLARLPGVGILSRGPMGTQTGFTVRGLSQNYVKVLVDGIDVSDPSGPQVAYDFGRLAAFNFGRAELLRGSQSAVHGSQAIGGVLSLETPRPEAEGVTQRLELEGGAHDTLAGAYSFGLRRGEDELGFQISRVRTDGFSAADEANGNTEPDGYEATRISLRGQTRIGEVVLGFAGFAQNDEGGFDDDFATPPVDGFDVTSHRERGARAFAQFATGAVDHEIGASYFSGYRYTTSAFGDYDFRGERLVLDWKAGTDLAGGRLSFGAERRFEDYSGTFVTGTVKTAVTGVYGEYAFAPAAGLDVVASLRHDEHSGHGGFTTGRLAATWEVADGLLLRGSLGTGFRAPSGYELYDGFSGNPDLEPEESRSLDLGIEKRLGETALRATLFRIETDNLIDYVAGSYEQVPGEAIRQGVELEAEGRLGARIGYSLAYTYTDWENPAGLSTGSAWNASFGRHQIAVGLDAEITERVTGALVLRHVADRQSLPDYTLVNAQLSYELGEGREAYLRVENLFDEQYQLWPGYGTSDRAFYVGLRAAF